MLRAYTDIMPLTVHDLAKMIDHSLLHPTMTDQILKEGCELALKYDVASVCIKPYAIPIARELLAGSDVLVGTVIGFPHGNSATGIKVAEAIHAAEDGAVEIDMVINIGKALGGDWEYVALEIDSLNKAVTERGAILKVIFENDFMTETAIVKLCQICSDVKVAFVKTSTGYGFVKQDTGFYSYKGATIPHLQLMRANSAPKVQIKAAGGVRTLKDLVLVRSVGVTRVGATATAAMLDEAQIRIDRGERLEDLIKSGQLSGGAY